MKLACISELMARAKARAARSPGQIGRSGKLSATNSMIANDSDTTMSPSCRTGTLPVGPTASISARVSGRYMGMTVSEKGMSKTLSRIQGRSDQEE